jgi:hypothetical protein
MRTLDFSKLYNTFGILGEIIKKTGNFTIYARLKFGFTELRLQRMLYVYVFFFKCGVKLFKQCIYLFVLVLLKEVASMWAR